MDEHNSLCLCLRTVVSMNVDKYRRERATDQAGRKVKGVYIRDGKFSAGFFRDGKWHMKNLKAQTLAEARHEREQMVARFRGNNKSTVPTKELDQLYTEARKLSQQMSLIKNKLKADLRQDISRAELLTMETTDLIFEVWKRAQR